MWSPSRAPCTSGSLAAVSALAAGRDSACGPAPSSFAVAVDRPHENQYRRRDPSATSVWRPASRPLLPLKRRARRRSLPSADGVPDAAAAAERTGDVPRKSNELKLGRLSASMETPKARCAMSKGATDGSASKRSRLTQCATKTSNSSALARNGGHDELAAPPHKERLTRCFEVAGAPSALRTAASGNPSPTPSACAAAARRPEPPSIAAGSAPGRAGSPWPTLVETAGAFSESASAPGSGTILASVAGCSGFSTSTATSWGGGQAPTRGVDGASTASTATLVDTAPDESARIRKCTSSVMSSWMGLAPVPQAICGAAAPSGAARLSTRGAASGTWCKACPVAPCSNEVHVRPLQACRPPQADLAPMQSHAQAYAVAQATLEIGSVVAVFHFC
eukprot:scaffold41812_cov32-Tisochrysis_lutea.AAC.4